MHAVILAAGEGSRLGGQGPDVPKAFMNLDGQTLYDRQRAILDNHVDDVTVVLGYAAETVLDEVGSANVVIVDRWDEYDNAESLRRALECIDDDVLVVNGDVVVAEATIERIIDRHAVFPRGRNAVACIPGYQDESTAIRCDDRGIVTEYGMIRGHRHAGLGIVDRANLDAAEQFLRHHRREWYPLIYPELETGTVAIAAGTHVEVNRPPDKLEAKRKFPLVGVGEGDAQTSD